MTNSGLPPVRAWTSDARSGSGSMPASRIRRRCRPTASGGSGRGQGPAPDLLDGVLERAAERLARAQRADDHERRVGDRRADVDEQQHRGDVGPLQVLDHVEQRAVGPTSSGSRRSFSRSKRSAPTAASAASPSPVVGDGDVDHARQGQNGGALRSVVQLPQDTSRSSRTRWARARATLVFPIPASPVSSTSDPFPAAASSATATSSSTKAPRPTRVRSSLGAARPAEPLRGAITSV